MVSHSIQQQNTSIIDSNISSFLIMLELAKFKYNLNFVEFVFKPNKNLNLF